MASPKPKYDPITNPIIRTHPLPLHSSADYAPSILATRLQYANEKLHNPQHKPSPIHQHALEGYKEACVRLLYHSNTPDDKEILENAAADNSNDVTVPMNSADIMAVMEIKEGWVEIMRSYEQGCFWLRPTMNFAPSREAEVLQDRIIELKKASLFARYGSIFLEAGEILKTPTVTQEVLNWQRNFSTDYWMDITKKLKAETKLGNRLTMVKGDIKSARHIWPSIIFLRDLVFFKLDDLLDLIKGYEKWDGGFEIYADLIPMVREKRYFDLAYALREDYCHLPKVLGPDDKSILIHFQNIISTIINTWYTRFPNDAIRDNSQMWNSNALLWQFGDHLKSQAIEANSQTGKDDDSHSNNRMPLPPPPLARTDLKYDTDTTKTKAKKSSAEIIEEMNTTHILRIFFPFLY